MIKDPKIQYQQVWRRRLFRALNYLTIYVYILVVYGGAIVTDFAFFQIVQILIADDANRYPLVSLWLDFARVILALLLLIFAIIHAILSTLQQIRMDWSSLRKDEDEL